jgi:hypothetical protein
MEDEPVGAARGENLAGVTCERDQLDRRAVLRLIPARCVGERQDEQALTIRSDPRMPDAQRRVERPDVDAQRTAGDEFVAAVAVEVAGGVQASLTDAG